jgi:hypothetical protein
MRGTLTWYRYRAITGLVFGLLGIVLAVEIALRPAPPGNKIAGGLFALVAIALGAARVQQYLKARTTQP